MRTGRTISVLSIICCATSVAGIVLSPPATGYELSVYTAYPIWLKIIFSITLVAAVLTTAHGAWTEIDREWLGGLALIWGLSTILFTIPTLRGYVLFGRGSYDVLLHFGMIREIEATAHLAARDWYPLTHILGYALSGLGLSDTSVVAVLQSTAFGSYLLGIVLYTRRLTNRRAARFGSLAATPLLLGMYHTGLHPAIISFFLLPIIFATLHFRSFRWRILTVMLLMALVFFHPVTAILAAVYGITVAVIVGGQQLLGRESLMQRPELAAIGAAGIALMMWYLSFDRSAFVVSRLARGEASRLGSFGAKSGSTDVLSTTQTVARALALYGDVFLIGGLSVIAAGVVLMSHHRGWTILLPQLAIGISLVGVLFVAGPIANPVRAARYYFIFAAVVIGVACATLVQHPAPTRWIKPLWRPRILVSAAIICLSVAFLVSASGVFLDTNHLTETETEAAKWSVERTAPRPFIGVGMSRKMTLYVMGTHAAPEVWRFQKYNERYVLPQHLGYRSNRCIGALSNNQVYILTKEHDRQFQRTYYPEQRETLNWHSASDIRRLQGDQSAHHLYDSGAASVWSTTDSPSSQIC